MSACPACGAAIKGRAHFGIHRDGFGQGPQVSICDACGGNEAITCEDLWAAIKVRRNARESGVVVREPKSVLEIVHAFVRALAMENHGVTFIQLKRTTWLKLCEELKVEPASRGAKGVLQLEVEHGSVAIITEVGE